MNILVTGAGGYVGIPLCERLQQSGHWVYGIDRYFFGKYHNVTNGSILTQDIRDIWAQYFYGVDCVIDLAGLSNDASCEIDNDLTLSINCEGGVRLARLAKRTGVKRYLYSSSASVYGDGSGLTDLTETSPTNPLTQYAKCKKSVEDELLELNGDGFEVVILRNSTIFGVAPRMRFDLAVNIMTARAWRDGLIYVMGGGEQWRPFVHVQDVVSAFEFLMKNGQAGEIYNVGDNEQNIRVHDLAYLVKDHVNARIHNIPDDADQRSYNLNFDKINALGWRCVFDIEYGIREIIEALKSGEVSLDDPTTHTLNWYKSLIEWEKRITKLQINGRIF